jgi:hypothetical protein
MIFKLPLWCGTCGGAPPHAEVLLQWCEACGDGICQSCAKDTIMRCARCVLENRPTKAYVAGMQAAMAVEERFWRHFLAYGEVFGSEEHGFIHPKDVTSADQADTPIIVD